MSTAKSAKSKSRKVVERKPKSQGWRTTDAEEIERRRLRAAKEEAEIQRLEPREAIFSTFRVLSEKGGDYEVEIRSLEKRNNSCTCPDWTVNRLGTCKHVEAVLAHLGKLGRSAAARRGSGRVEIFLDTLGQRPEARIAWPAGARASSALHDLLDPYFSSEGAILTDPATVLPSLLRKLDAAPPQQRRRVRVSGSLLRWLEEERHRGARRMAREAFEADVRAGKRSFDLVRLPLYDYQREGMLHLAFTERALLADEMGLGKTVQAIAACELLRQLRGIERVLVISPASLKGEWEEQIAKFTGLPSLLVLGPRATRLRQYRQSSFFYLANYEQILVDGEEIQRQLAPDVIILDEAQRIKNWRTKTAEAVKRLESPYAFVLTGTPLENRIDDVYSIVQFLDPKIFGPLFRFNRDFHQLDERGKPTGYKNLDEMHRRLRPVLLRRRKSEVEDQLPERSINTYVVPMSNEQRGRYDEYKKKVARLVVIAERRPLTPEEFERLQRYLACMRMLCDTPYILDPDCRDCPKLAEVEEIFGQFLADDGRKMLVFSEWERMLEMVRELAEAMGIGYAWHTGSVPQPKRRKEIHRFKEDPACRLFLSTDSGSVGLNLQAASVVVNLDQPWNPARLEQRIARAWRKHQKNAVHVVNLVTEDSIEQRMLQVLVGKQLLAEGVIDGRGDLDAVPMPSARAAFVQRLEEVLGTRLSAGSEKGGPVPIPRAERVRQDLVALLGEGLLGLEVHPGSEGHETLLAVAEPGAEVRELSAKVEKIVDEHWADAPRKPRIEILDPATYQTLQRLVAAGAMSFAGEGPRVLHRSPRLEEAPNDDRPQRLEGARAALAEGGRKLRMVALLRDGGFPVEALPALLEAFEAALASFAHIAGVEVEDGHPLGAASFHPGARRQLLGLETVLEDELLPFVLALRGRAGDFPEMEEAEAASRITEGEKVFPRIEEALYQAALHP